MNFYLSSITIENFKFEPTKKIQKIIWEYLNAANLIGLEDIENKEKLKNLEIAANSGQLEANKIFDIYKKIPFSLNNLINANNIYQTLERVTRELLYIKNFYFQITMKSRIKLLFLLDDLFKKDNLSNIYSAFMSDRLKEIDTKEIPKSYLEVVQKNIKLTDENLRLGKIKYDDKILHRSKLIKYFGEEIKYKKNTKRF